MTLPATVLRTDAASATRVWDVLAERVESFIQIWESSPDPPNLADYLPKEPPALRFMTLVELIKVDLEYQWQWGRDPKSLERYLLEFPELGGLHGAPCDLIYEEFHIRRQAGDSVEPEHYLKRFPRQAEELGKLLKLDAPRVTTALFPVKRMAEIEAGQQLDDFDLLSKLGAGAFATVYLAWQRTMQRQVALKVSGDQGNEPQTLSRLDHPHIVRVYDQRTLPDRKLRLLYMQYVPGGTLQAVVETIRRVPAAERSGKHLLETVDKAVDPQGGQAGDSLMRHKLAGASWPYVVCWMGARLAAALDYAHRQGVLHRDVKPANVLLAADGSPKLADFNISYNAQLEGATPAAYFGGSLPYMSTEQLEACNPAHPRKPEELDGRSDVYSLGVLLWELLVGRRPFEDLPVDAEWSKTLAAMCQDRALGVSLETQKELPRDCPAGLEQILLQCLAAKPEDRFANAGQLARQLELCLQPKAQQLLRPRRANVQQTVRRFSIPVLAMAAILPNAASSVLNIIYNWKAIVEGSDPVAQAVFQHEALIAVNVLVYSTGIGVLAKLAWPVCAAVPRLVRGVKLPPQSLLFLRRRCLWIGDYCAWMTFVGWTVAGTIFAVWYHLETQEPAFDLSQPFHFVASHVVCGLVAGTLAFFAVTFITVRCLFPPLIREEIDDAATIGQLQALRKRLSWYFGSAVASPLLSVMFLATIGLRLGVGRLATMDPANREALLSNAGMEIQVAFSVVALLGMLIFGLSWYFSRAIESDVAALSMAVAPAVGTFSSDSTTVDSFWTSGER